MKNDFPELFQSMYKYKTGHSMEIALLNVHKNVLELLDEKENIALILLDLKLKHSTQSPNPSVTHENDFKVSGTALKWFHKYLTTRIQGVNLHLYDKLSTAIT